MVRPLHRSREKENKKAAKLICPAAPDALALLIPVLVLLHLFVAPYTKVEESFHIQAVHDILAHGLPDRLGRNHTNYDHFAFPGAVPRTAIGAAVLAKLSQPVISLNEGIDRQILGMD